ncbi:MAG: hypothetical protein NTW64_01835 [Candidatus Omnitrophica bacterium]|nr:hypothetical protein [Candidatus Omnitrophota bacterium]
MHQIKIAKLEAARRQLETAVMLYFNEKDPVAIHTLVAAAHEIIRHLNKKAGGIPLVLEGKMVKEEYRKDFLREINKAKNFFKHAETDPSDVLDFNPDGNDYYLLDACESYELLTSEKNLYFIIYRGWFHYKHPQYFSNPIAINLINNKFGDNKTAYFISMIEASLNLSDK